MFFRGFPISLGPAPAHASAPFRGRIHSRARPLETLVWHGRRKPPPACLLPLGERKSAKERVGRETLRCARVCVCLPAERTSGRTKTSTQRDPPNQDRNHHRPEPSPTPRETPARTDPKSLKSGVPCQNDRWALRFCRARRAEANQLWLFLRNEAGTPPSCLVTSTGQHMSRTIEGSYDLGGSSRPRATVAWRTPVWGFGACGEALGAEILSGACEGSGRI